MTDRGSGLREHGSRCGDDVGTPRGAQRVCVTTRKQLGWQFGFSTTRLGEADVRRQHDVAMHLDRVRQVCVRVAAAAGLAEQPAQFLRLFGAAEIGRFKQR
jgi:hypothetical protein